MSLYRDLFNFAAKVGCLEGYLHERRNANISTMPDWVGNIESMYQGLPEEVKKDLIQDYRTVLGKALGWYQKFPNKDEEVFAKLKEMVAQLGRK